MSKILEALVALDAKRDAREREQEQRVSELTAENAELTKLLQTATAMSSRRTMALGLMIAHLQAQGLTREQIDRLTMGTLDLDSEHESG